MLDPGPAELPRVSTSSPTPARRIRLSLGAGLITGVADDDPSGIATYAQAGAQYRFGLLWTMPFTYPLMAAVQLMCARVGRVTGLGLAANIRRLYSTRFLAVVVGLLLIANILNIAADLAAMGEAVELVTGLPRYAASLMLTGAMLGLQVLVPYHRYIVVLRWLTVSLLAYAGVLATMHVPWRAVGLSMVAPPLHLGGDAAAMILAVFGTTISPYLFFWQASEEVEDMHGAPSLNTAPDAAPDELRRISWDTWTGMFYSNLSSFFIILATALTLGAAGITHIDTAAQAAQALTPLAGRFAGLLFATGIIGVGLVGVPVLAASAAYAVSETMGWRYGLELKAREARGFYGIIAASMVVAALLELSPISPMRALVWSAIINGVIAIPLMALLIRLATSKRVMGAFTSSWPIVVLALIATGVMALAAVVMIASFFA